MKKHVEIKTIEHKGIEVVVKIDFDAGTASLVEAQKGSMPTVYGQKQWVFANRGLEYMQGWLNILEAMTVAVKECRKDLEWKLAEDSKFRNDIEVAAQKEIKNAKAKRTKNN